MKKSRKIAASILSLFIFSALVVSANAKEVPNVSTPVEFSAVSMSNTESNNQANNLLDTDSVLSNEAIDLKNIADTHLPTLDGVRMSRSTYLIGDEIMYVSGNITSSNPYDLYFIDLPESRSLVYGLVSNNKDLQVHFCTYGSGAVSSTGNYAGAGQVAAANGAKADRYVLWVTDKSGNYVSDASYTLYLNYSVQFREGMNFGKFAGDLSYVMTYKDADWYINDAFICKVGERMGFNYSNANYFSPSNSATGKSGMYQGFYEDYAEKNGILFYDLSTPVKYVSTKHQSNNAILLFFGTGNVVRIDEYDDFQPGYSTRTMLTDEHSQNNFVVFDYKTGEYFDMYLEHPEVPASYRLPFSIEKLN